MNKYLKHLLCLGVLSLNSSAYAQISDACGTGQMKTCTVLRTPQAPHVCDAGPSRNEVLADMQSSGSTPLCYWKQPIEQGDSQPTGYWVKTWGAIATSVTETILGAAKNASTQSEAEHLALADCKNNGGTECKADIAYYNQCIAVVVGEKSYSRVTATTVSEATWSALKDCEDKNKHCGIFYLACTEPRFIQD